MSRINTVKDIAEAIESFAPAALQEEWDNTGIQTGFEEMPVRRILTCLEVDREVVYEAKKKNVDMIVSHHPLIFNSLKKISDGDPAGRLIIDILESGLSVYSCHTPFDKIKGGNNDTLAKLMGLTGIKNLKGESIESPQKMIEKKDEYDIGRTGAFKEEITFREVIDMISSRLQLSVREIRFVGDLDRKIEKVGICTGAGAEYIGTAASCGCALFVTGDVKYHDAREAAETGICLLDAGHYGTEKLFGAAMKEKLEKKIGGEVEIIASEVNLNPFNVI